MFGDIFYHKTHNKVMAAFGTLFNDITVVRRDENDEEIERIKVPIAYGPRDKFLVRIADDPDLERPGSITLPRMSFEMIDYSYDGDRKLNTNRKVSSYPTSDQRDRVFNPVPYNLSVNVSVMTRYMDDGNQIIEQILPWFTPEYTIGIKSLPELDLRDDIDVVLNNVSLIIICIIIII
jgi:hypothetical protein